MAQRLRETWPQTEKELPGPVEVDESFIGGKEKNKHEARKLQEGRGAEGKTENVGVQGRATGKIQVKALRDVFRKSLQDFMRQHDAAGAIVFTERSYAVEGIVQNGFSRYGRTAERTIAALAAYPLRPVCSR